jgi:hypothetical protein
MAFRMGRSKFRPQTARGFFLYLCCIAFLFEFPSAATYYIANSGSDQNDGKSAGLPLATLSAAKTKLKTNDTILLNRGDVFRESLNVGSVSNPTFGCYGPAQSPKPVISGSTPITQWTVYKGNIWTASCDKKIYGLFANNVLMTIARYPDTGWLRPDTMTENADGSNTVIGIAALTQNPRNAANYWTNAQIRWRHWSWWFETRPVIAYDASGKLYLGGTSTIHIDPANGTRGWGFYIDNKFEELDAPGEWCFDSAAKKVYFYPLRGGAPNTMLVEGSCRSTGLSLAGGTVENICFSQQTFSGLLISKTSIVDNCRFEHIGGDQGGSALGASWDIANSHIFNNVFADNLNIGISWYENSGRIGTSVIEYDTLINTGTVPGYGGTGTWHAVGILVHLTVNAKVQYNYIDKTGYAGILLGSDGNFVEYNIIKRAMWTLNDGGAIYTDCSKSTILNNIIYDTKGNLESSGPWYPLGHGIWLEFLGDYRQSDVENNTIVRSGCNGIYLPNNFSDTVRNNVLFDNAVTALSLDGQLTNSSTNRTQNLPQNNVISGNVCYAASLQQEALLFRPEYNYGAMAGNFFCNPFTDSVVSGYGTGNNQWRIYNYTLSTWKPMFSWTDKSAETDPFKRPRGLSADNPYGKGKIFINESPVQQEFSLGTTAYKDLDGNAMTGPLVVPAFSSKILVQCDSTVSGVRLGEFKTTKSDFTLVNRTGRTVLKYRLSRTCAVAITLYDQAGRISFRSSNAEGPGIYVTDFGNRKSNLVSGVYTCTMSIDAQGERARTIGKFVVVK